MNVLGMAWQALMTCLRNPVPTTAVVLIVWGWAELGLARVAGCIGLVLVVALVWRLAHRASYHRLIGGPCRRWWRLRFRYRRYWPAAMTTCGLTKRYQGVVYIPRLRKLHCTPYTDVVHVRLLSGQAPEMYEAVTGQLAHTFGALSCHVRVAGWLRTSTLRSAEPFPAGCCVKWSPRPTTRCGGPSSISRSTPSPLTIRSGSRPRADTSIRQPAQCCRHGRTRWPRSNTTTRSRHTCCAGVIRSTFKA